MSSSCLFVEGTVVRDDLGVGDIVTGPASCRLDGAVARLLNHSRLMPWRSMRRASARAAEVSPRSTARAAKSSLRAVGCV